MRTFSQRRADPGRSVVCKLQEATAVQGGEGTRLLTTTVDPGGGTESEGYHLGCGLEIVDMTSNSECATDNQFNELPMLQFPC